MDIHSQAYAYVVGALTPSENHEYETHLSDCPDCSKEVAAMRDVTARLSEAVAVAPPAALRTSILAMIAQTPQDAPLPPAWRGTAGAAGGTATSVPAQVPGTPTTGRGDGADPSTAGQRDRSGGDSNVIPIRRSWASRGTALVAAAAVLGAVGFGGWALQAREAAQRDAQVAAAQADRLTRVLAAGDLQTASGTFADGGAGTVVRSRSEGVAMLVAAGFPALPEGRVYEAWTIDGDPVPAGTFSSDAGRAALVLPEAALDTDSVAVTIEPAGGSDHPTTDAVFAVDLADA